MLEILLLYGLCKGMGNMMRSKGRSPVLLQVLVVVAWVGGEVFGFFCYGVFKAVQGASPDQVVDLGGYGVAVLAAALGVGTIFLIGSIVPAATPQPQPVGAYGNSPYQMGPPTDPQNPYNPYGDPRP